jgi:large subunit ribosomal protein L10
MKREEKGPRIAELQQRFEAAKLAVVTDYRGLTAGQLDRIRSEIRAAEGECRVAKNTLTRRAIADTHAREIGSLLSGPTAFVFAYQDPVAVAKIIVRFAGEYKALEIKGGVFEGEFLAPEAVKGLAELPSREQLLGRFLGVLQAPAVQLLRTLQEPAARMARLADALRRKREEGQSGGA